MYKTYNQRVGALIRLKRKSHGFTLANLAELSGVSSSRISEIEIGKNNTRITTLMKILDALNIDSAEIMKIEEKVQEPVAEEVAATSEGLANTDKEIVASVIENFITANREAILALIEKEVSNKQTV